MLGTRKNPIEEGWYYIADDTHNSRRYKLPHGWLLAINKCFVPFAEDGTGWGKNDPADIAGEKSRYLPSTPGVEDLFGD